MYSKPSLFRASTFAIVAAATLFGTLQQAQAQIVIGGSAVSEGNASSFPALGSGSNVLQMLFNPSALSTLTVGDNIAGLAFRFDGARSTNSPAISFADYDIYLGQAADNSLESEFAVNYSVAGPRTQVRNGGLSLAAGALIAGPGAGPEQFGPTIAFDTAYSYKGGGLIIEIRHSGNGVQNLFLDATNFGASSALTNGPSTALGGVGISAPVTRLAIGPATVPEAGTGALLGLAALPALGAVVIRRVGRRKGGK